MAQLGKISVLYLGDQTQTTFEAPESLTGCGPEKPKGFFACTSALVMEVCPAAILKFRS